MSFYDHVADQYEDWSAKATDDIDFYVELAGQSNGPILELAVGDGRVAVPVAQATGRRVIGIDTSTGMLEQAKQKAVAAGVELDLRHSEMQDLAVDEPCGCIYCPGRSLLHIPTWQQRRRVFERVAQSLQPGGIFAWNVFALDHRFAAQLDGEPQTTPAPHVNHYDVADNRIDMVLDNGATTSLWWATKNEWLGLIDVAGLEIDALHGDFDRSELNAESREYVFITRKP